MTHHHVTRSGTADCAAFEARLADYLEGDLPPAPRAAAERHLAACAACSALVADLRALTDEARALPPLEPSRDLWAGIAARVEAPVVSLPARRAGAEPSWLRRPWLAAAAVALLMAGSAGVTYLATGRTPAAAPAAPAAPAPRTVALAPGLVRAPAGPDSVVSTPVTAGAESPAPTPTAQARPRGGAPTRLAANGAAPAAALQAYDVEIAQLRRVLDERRGSLDTATVRILQQNLGIIDRAIRESRAALARDPASRLLYQQLNAALDTKLELMRTAVLLTTE